ncbi:hypothetical protein C6P40_004987 [Pichia californica]|uniref:Uncharacterized protein n=1 Tax=Pichia californica TaxID=460514 RepID=A0A9P6WLR5_9ASCO|nr:hypothetical protein C6P42_005345 [[Candida] californica]KAG0689451.1 hypothetical protein C6P40_004987 [[Candida] californica]
MIEKITETHIQQLASKYEDLKTPDGFTLKNSPLYNRIKKMFPNFLLYEKVLKYYPLLIDTDRSVSSLTFTTASQLEQLKIFPCISSIKIELAKLYDIQQVLKVNRINYSSWADAIKLHCIHPTLQNDVKHFTEYDQLLTYFLQKFNLEFYEKCLLSIATNIYWDNTRVNKYNIKDYGYKRWIEYTYNTAFESVAINSIKQHMIISLPPHVHEEINNSFTLGNLLVLSFQFPDLCIYYTDAYTELDNLLGVSIR